MRTNRRTSADSRRSNRSAAVGLALSIVVGSVGGVEAATTTISSSGPLTSIGISDQLNCSVYHVGGGHQFYAGTACGTLLAVDGVLYGPSSIPAGGGAAPRTGWTPVSQSAVTGAGTDADPHLIETVVSAGATGLSIVEKDAYVVGRDSYRTTVRIENTGPAAVDVVLYRAGDCYLGGSDYGYGFVIDSVGAVACSKTANNVPADRVEQWVPITGGNDYFQSHYSTVWSHVGTQAPFPNTCRCNDYIDNGAGISWSLNVPAGGSATVSHVTNFGLSAELSSTRAKAAILDLATEDAEGLNLLALSADVSDSATGDPITDAPVEFYVGSELVCTGTTDADGSASCIGLVELASAAVNGQYTALFPGNSSYLASADTAGRIRIQGEDLF